MSNLFLILGIIIVVVIVGAIVWKRKRRRRRRRVIDMADRPEHDLYTDRYFDEPVIELDSDDKPDPLFDAPLIDDSISTSDTEFIDGSVQMLDTKTVSLSQAEKFEELPVEKPQKSPPKKVERKSEMIIVLYVVAKHQSGFAGQELLTLLESLGLKHGKMSIFHHYGIGDLKVQNAVFSLANMVEPGTFEPQYMSEFSTPGLVLFMRLPGPFGGRVAFELMLNNAGRIAEVLEGTIEDEKHALLTPKTISALRERIANFEQRSTNLSMLKRFS
jgi:cell division protein ZipA